MSLRPIFTPVWRSAPVLNLWMRPIAPQTVPVFARQPISPHSLTSQFSTTRPVLARKKRNRGPKPDTRITLIRYHLQHPRNPRPLRFSRSRYLRHWTINRAWQLYRSKQRIAQERSLERQYNCMREACEALRLTGEDGLAIAEVPLGGIRPLKGLRGEKTTSETGREGMDLKAAAEKQKEVGKLYRIAMTKAGSWDSIPIEYARSQTETPPRDGWNYSWTR